LLIPQRRGFQLFGGLRMAEDAHGACRECPSPLAQPGGN
jgi:hypothetical protein